MDFGYWHVKKKLPSIKKKYSSGRVQTVAQYLCECKCGKENILTTNGIKNSNSCGCYRKQVSKNNREINLQSQKFGELTVIKLLGQIKNDSSNYWFCKCSCGNYTKVSTSSLRSGNTKSCGCKKGFRPVNYIPIGTRFERLKVSCIYNKSSYADTTYLCDCDCGNKTIVRHLDLITRHTKSCGCLHIESSKENIKSCCSIKDISGKRFGKLTAIKPTNNRRGTSVEWECLCDCGRTTYVSSGNLRDDGYGTISCGCAESKGNMQIQDYLKKNKYIFEMEYSFNNLRGINNGLLRFDACVFNNDGSIKALIEFDGIFQYKKQYDSDGYECLFEHG